MNQAQMSESSLSENTPIEETNSCEAEDEKPLYAISENNSFEENSELKEVEEDLELLELQDEDVSGSIVFEFKTNELQAPISSPRLATKNRRYTLRPQKRSETTECDNFTSTNNRKKSTSLPKNSCLETIFENPILKNGALSILGKKKMKRYLSFDTFVSKAKLRHRKLKLKRLGKKKKKSSHALSIEDVKLKLKNLEDEDDEWMDIQE